ncbi:hypothetical protein CLCR_07998 [Cladophialophora carrionii]|uniref:Dynamin family protein n=1 Tax=Cladophialophora carrionii TaxID=86049 RepID=A0A1C1CUF0_9EURO|nr:hypothetical protein CLCR_07998 [Cladophialophora carrionii]
MQSENSPDSPGRLTTPATSSDSSHSPSVPTGEDIDPDEPLPSIEMDPGLEATLTTEGDSSLRARSPSFSITPPTFGGNTVSTTSSTTPNGHDDSPTTPTMTQNGGHAAPTSPIRGLTASMASIGLGPDGLQSSPQSHRTLLSPQSPTPDRVDAAISPGSASRRHSRTPADRTPHAVTDEEPPHQRFYDPDVQLQLAISKGLVQDLVYALESSSLHDEPESRIRALYLQAIELSQYQNPSVRTVGLVGDSGVDRKGLARTSNIGRACTCVVTEYHYHENVNFALEVEYFTQEELRKQFTELLQSYRTHHLHDDTNMMADDRTDLQKKSRGLPVMDGTNMVPRTEFASADIFSDHLMGLTSEPADASEPSKWPFIRKIRVYLDTYILSKGLVLVDLPGLRDLNSARLKITERYLLHCDEVFAVCNIGRAATDPGIKEVFELARKASLSKIGIVCTKSDEIRADEAVRDWDGETKIQIQRMAKNVNVLEETAKRTQAELDEINSDSDSDLDVGMDDQMRGVREQLNRTLKRTRKSLARAKFELKKYLGTTRNQQVTEALRMLYENQTSAVDLAVFCISNFDYWEYRDEPKDQALPFLQLSGILQVRRRCLSLVVEGQLRAATEYVTNAIPALLGSIELWIQAGAGGVGAERKQAIRSALDRIELELEARWFDDEPALRGADNTTHE